MTKHLVGNSIRKFLTLTLALGGLAAGALMYAATPAEAKSMCLKKAQACESRCARAYKNYLPCIQRTCDKQYDNCTRA